MEEYELEEKGETFAPIDFEPIQIEQNDIKYILNIKANDENDITLSIKDMSQYPSVIYTNSLTLRNIKELNVFSTLNSINDFYNHIKLLYVNNNLNITKCNDIISLILNIEIKSKKQEIKINLFPTKEDIEFHIKEIFQELLNIRNELKELKNENIILKKDNEELKNKINLLEKDNEKLNLEINNIKKEKDEKKEKKEINLLDKDKQKLNIENNIIKNENKKNENIKNLNNENKINNGLVNQIYNEINDEYEISDLLEEDIVKNKIIELKYDREKITEWIENYLENV